MWTYFNIKRLMGLLILETLVWSDASYVQYTVRSLLYIRVITGQSFGILKHIKQRTHFETASTMWSRFFCLVTFDSLSDTADFNKRELRGFEKDNQVISSTFFSQHQRLFSFVYNSSNSFGSCGSDWNINIEWNLCTNIHQSMNPDDFGDPVAFPHIFIHWTS